MILNSVNTCKIYLRGVSSFCVAVDSLSTFSTCCVLRYYVCDYFSTLCRICASRIQLHSTGIRMGDILGLLIYGDVHFPIFNDAK